MVLRVPYGSTHPSCSALDASPNSLREHRSITVAKSRHCPLTRRYLRSATHTRSGPLTGASRVRFPNFVNKRVRPGTRRYSIAVQHRIPFSRMTRSTRRLPTRLPIALGTHAPADFRHAAHSLHAPPGSALAIHGLGEPAHSRLGRTPRSSPCGHL